MTEKDRFFAIIPIHGKNALIEGDNVAELQQGIDEVLVQPEISFPFHDFRSEIEVIKGRKVKLPPQEKT